MSTSLSAQINLTNRPVHQSTNPNGNYSGSPGIAYTSNLTSANIAKIYSNQRTISGSSETLNVTSGLSDQYGDAINLTTLSVLNIVNNSANILTIGGGSDPALGTDQHTIGPGNCLYIDGSWAISGSACNLLVSASGTGSLYTILFYGS